jgi:hypothetical protein
MLCENPKTNVAAKNSWKSRGRLKNMFFVRVRMFLTLFCYYVPEDCVIISFHVIDLREKSLRFLTYVRNDRKDVILDTYL